MSIWFCSLKTDWYIRRHPELKEVPFVLANSVHGRMIVNSANKPARKQGISKGITVADARSFVHSLQVVEDQPGLFANLLHSLCEYCVRYSPVVATDEPDGLMMDITGCAHLWGGEQHYLTEIYNRFKKFGYEVQLSIADTIGSAWGFARFTQHNTIVEIGEQVNALLCLPPAALRLEPAIIERLEKLGLCRLESFIKMPRPSLRRRFGAQLLQRIDEAVGIKEEFLVPVCPIDAYHERLPCVEPIATATGIRIALERLLQNMCKRLLSEQKGLRNAILKGYRLDGKIEMINIGTNRPSCNSSHLYKLFEIKLDSIEPALGIELFTLDAEKVEDLPSKQEDLWQMSEGLDDNCLAELLDRLAGRIGVDKIRRFMPEEHYWPERSYKATTDINEKIQTTWKLDRPRPLHILFKPDLIEVTAPIPDYPPMLFRYNGKLHKILKADGPERIEQEWWLQQGQHRDYYNVEDEDGHRYWLFRLGHYDNNRNYQWFIHGFFA